MSTEQINSIHCVISDSVYIIASKGIVDSFVNNCFKHDLEFAPKYSQTFGNMEQAENVQCYSVHRANKDTSNPVYFVKIPVAYGLEFIEKLKASKLSIPVTVSDKRYNKVHPEFDKLVPKQINLSHPKAHPCQKVLVPAVIKMLEEKSTAFLKAGTGLGKSPMSLYIAKHFKTRTLVVTHRQKLLNIFKDTCIDPKNGLGVLPKDLGYIYQGEENLEAPIVISTIQSILSLMKNKPVNYLHDMFGFIIFDECDTLGAKEFSRVMSMINAGKVLGMTATVSRGDGLEGVFLSYFGKKNIVEASSDALPMKLVVSDVITQLHPQLLSPLLFDKAIVRNKTFLDHAGKLGKMLYDKGRYTVVFAKQKRTLLEYKQRLIDLGVPIRDIGDYFGEPALSDGIPPHLLSIAVEKKPTEYFKAVEKHARIILATYGMMSRGVSIEHLDAGISLTEVSDMTQPFGRVRRPPPVGKIKPLAIWYIFRHTNIKHSTSRIGKIIEKCRTDSNIIVVEK